MSVLFLGVPWLTADLDLSYERRVQAEQPPDSTTALAQAEGLVELIARARPHLLAITDPPSYGLSSTSCGRNNITRLHSGHRLRHPS